MDRLESYNALPEMNALNEMKRRKPRKKRVKKNAIDTAEMLRQHQFDEDDDP